jgi:hypothetical protein
MNRRRSCALCALALALLPALVPAQQPAPARPAAAPAAAPDAAQAASGPVYQVELIVFRANSGTGGSENWSAGVLRGVPSGTSGEAASSGDNRVARLIGPLPSSSFQLNDIEQRLKSSGAYVPLAHVAWSQTASAWGTRAGFPIERLGIAAQGLTGVITLERGTFLHLGMSLSYTPATPPSGLGASPGTGFTLEENRRVRFNERHYFDHPAFGVIAVVRPAQPSR